MRTNGANQPLNFIVDIADVLTDMGIPYAVIGAFAVSYYGIPRGTADADAIVWLRSTGKMTEITNRLRSAGYSVEPRRGDIDDPIENVIVVKDEHHNRADLLIGVRGMDPAAQIRCMSAKLQDFSLNIIAPEDLIGMKLFAGGPQDLIDVEGILQISGGELDLQLLRDIARRYGPDIERKLEGLRPPS